ncbi:helix-turn-helix domain-containing protein [Paenibacillus puerhi]|uniref:helix-turn-helix domain-containing protein n=1 Tax=Paenibacillus puerhi TaxID=2692622 RepID=UPI0013586CDC|nr:helix-turn-helix domain-containing protein [Paenibacillus puerhi]
MKPASKSDLILHPVRLKIIQALVPDKRLTRQKLSELFPEIPQATMYRHLNTLEKGGLIDVVEQYKQRGATEKVYALRKEAESVPHEDLQAMDAEQHMELFLKLISGLIADFGSYVAQDRYDLVKDGVSLRQLTLYLNEDELHELLGEVREAYAKRMSLQAAPDRRRRTFTNLIIPGPPESPKESKHE